MHASNIIMLLTAPLALAGCNGVEDHTAMDEMPMEGHDMSAMSEGMTATPIAAPIEAPIEAPVSATGIITAIDAEARTITIDHAPVPELQWPQMVMAFEVEDGVGADLAVGDAVTFAFLSGEDGNAITSISKR